MLIILWKPCGRVRTSSDREREDLEARPREQGWKRPLGRRRIIRYWHGELSDPVSLLAKASSDPFPRTRMEAILSAGYVPSAEAFSAALGALDHPRDKFIDLALPQTVTALEKFWRPALEKGNLSFAQASHRAFAEEAAGIGFEKRRTNTSGKNPPPFPKPTGSSSGSSPMRASAKPE